MAQTIPDRREAVARDLVKGLRRRDPALLDCLIERYQYRLFRYLLFLTGRPDVAEDIFQETWVRVVEKGHLYDGRKNFESWLFTVARNIFIDLARRKKSSVSLEEMAEPAADDKAFEPAAASVTPLESLACGETREQLGVAMSKIPGLLREVLVLRFQEDMKLEEIAALVGAPLPTVKSRLYRGLQMLRERLEGQVS